MAKGWQAIARAKEKTDALLLCRCCARCNFTSKCCRCRVLIIVVVVVVVIFSAKKFIIFITIIRFITILLEPQIVIIYPW